MHYHRGSLNYIGALLRISLDDLSHNKIRTALTSLGILIGIFSVVFLSAMGLGLKRYIEDQFRSIGANLVMVMPGRVMQKRNISLTDMMIQGKFDEKDLNNLRRVSNIAVVTGAYHIFPEFQGDKGAETYELIATSPEMFEIMNMSVQKGELFDKSDNDKGDKVTVLGANPAKKLFGSVEDAVSKNLKIENQAYKVIGVLTTKGGGGGAIPSIDDHVFIPFKSAHSFNPSKKYYGIYAKLQNEAYLDETKNEIKKILLKRYNEDDFSVLDQREIFNSMSSIFAIINFVLIGIASISLVVGGIGIMNIMYVSVVQRIREIGIRRAFGARKKDILYLFLLEAIILSVMGGIIGLGTTFILVKIMQKVFPAYIDVWSVIVALGVASMIGLTFGVLPAKKAADFTPVEAIRHE